MNIDKEPIINVGILVGSTVEFELKGNFTHNSKTLNPNTYKASISNNQIETSFTQKKIVELKAETNSTFVLKNVTIGIGFHWEQTEDQEFEGGLKLIIENGEIRAINVIPLESYLKSVISSEMSAMNDLTLLKVHAIVSRSWLLAQIYGSTGSPTMDSTGSPTMDSTGSPTMGSTHSATACSTNLPTSNEEEIVKWYDRDDHDNFDVCADDHCQRYQGICKIISEKAQQAVNETRGTVITYDNKICDARFSKCCGGYSENFENVWQNTPVPYLSKISDLKDSLSPLDNAFYTSSPKAFCNTTDTEILQQVLVDFDQKTTDFFRWKITYTQHEISSLIQKRSEIDFGNILDLVPLSRGKSGRIIRLKIIGAKQTVIVGKELEIRKWLSESHLYSSAFIVEKQIENTKHPKAFTLYGAGWGHGVGMCQIGAAVMSKQGFTINQIITHYFNDSNLKKLY